MLARMLLAYQHEKQIESHHCDTKLDCTSLMGTKIPFYKITQIRN